MVLSVPFIYNHSLTMEQCIKLSELNLQQQLTESPWAFRKIMLSKNRFSTGYLRNFFTYIFLEQLADLCSHFTSSNSLYEYACSNYHYYQYARPNGKLPFVKRAFLCAKCKCAGWKYICGPDADWLQRCQTTSLGQWDPEDTISMPELAQIFVDEFALAHSFLHLLTFFI